MPSLCWCRPMVEPGDVVTHRELARELELHDLAIEKMFGKMLQTTLEPLHADIKDVKQKLYDREIIIQQFEEDRKRNAATFREHGELLRLHVEKFANQHKLIEEETEASLKNLFDGLQRSAKWAFGIAIFLLIIGVNAKNLLEFFTALMKS